MFDEKELNADNFQSKAWLDEKLKLFKIQTTGKRSILAPDPKEQKKQQFKI